MSKLTKVMTVLLVVTFTGSMVVGTLGCDEDAIEEFLEEFDIDNFIPCGGCGGCGGGCYYEEEVLVVVRPAGTGVWNRGVQVGHEADGWGRRNLQDARCLGVPDFRGSAGRIAGCLDAHILRADLFNQTSVSLRAITLRRPER